MRPGNPKRKFKRLFLAADIHCSELVFRKFLSVADFYDADALLIGGDITAKTISPIVIQPDGRYRARLSGTSSENLSGRSRAIPARRAPGGVEGHPPGR